MNDGDRRLSAPATGVVIVDEAHERTLRTDILIANLKTILETRNHSRPAATDNGKGKATESSDKPNPLKVIIMSATLEADKFSSFFNKCVDFTLPGCV